MDVGEFQGYEPKITQGSFKDIMNHDRFIAVRYKMMMGILSTREEDSRAFWDTAQ